jgi:hypothetical protein
MKYYEQLCTNKLDKWNEMGKYLEIHKLSRLAQEKCKISTDLWQVLKILPTKKSPRLDGFTSEFYKTFNKNLTVIVSKNLPKKLEEEGTLSSTFYEARIILILKIQIP